MRRKILHILFLTAILILENNPLLAQEAALSSTRQVTIEYQSQDECNNPVTLSATLTLPADEQSKISRIVLSNTSFGSVASFVMQKSSLICSWASLASQNSVVVEPSSVVKGSSKLQSIPTYSYNLAGRQYVDALFATIEYLRNNGLLSDDYKSYLIGYGTGANATVAALRCLERDYSETEQAAAHLNGTFYAGNAKDPIDIWRDALACDTTYSAYNTVVMLDEMLGTYSEGCMKSYTDNDVFSQKLISSGILSIIRYGNFTEAAIAEQFFLTFGTVNPTVSQIVSDEMTQAQSPVRLAMEKALFKNSTPDVWQAKTPVYAVIEDATGTGASVNNAAVQQIMTAVKNWLVSAECQFVASAVSKILGTDGASIPIFLYYEGNILIGSLVVDETMKTTLNIGMYTMFLSKTADINVSISTDAIVAQQEQLPGTLTVNYHDHGEVDINADVNNVIPFIKNMGALTGNTVFSTKEEADSVAQVLNGALNSVTVDLNGYKNWFTADMGSREGDEAGTYAVEFIFNRDDRKIGITTIFKLLE